MRENGVGRKTKREKERERERENYGFVKND